MRAAFESLRYSTDKGGGALPQNSTDLFRRRLDCAVVRRLLSILGANHSRPVDTLEGVLTGGAPRLSAGRRAREDPYPDRSLQSGLHQRSLPVNRGQLQLLTRDSRHHAATLPDSAFTRCLHRVLALTSSAARPRERIRPPDPATDPKTPAPPSETSSAFCG